MLLPRFVPSLSPIQSTKQDFASQSSEFRGQGLCIRRKEKSQAVVFAPVLSSSADDSSKSRLFTVGTVEERLVRWRKSVLSATDANPRKRVYIVRKGPSSWNMEGRIQGKSDLSILNPRGQDVAALIGDALRNIKFDHVYSSPLQRCKQTAEIILARNDYLEKPTKARRLVFDGRRFGGFPLTFLKSLQEIDLGEWEGKTKEEVIAKWPSEWKVWTETPWSTVMPLSGRNPVRDVWDQAAMAWDDILGTDDSTILIVAHNAVNKALIGTALGLDIHFYRTLCQSYGGISILNFLPNGTIEVECINGTGHMVKPRATSPAPLSNGTKAEADEREEAEAARKD
mmetsp:Transcript_3129/g.4776  ORF Transcript_3129/g.4776 Transcript_3129/m.4776 type:complete len:341 (+) Transcript_3129:122-1144(+)